MQKILFLRDILDNEPKIDHLFDLIFENIGHPVPDKLKTRKRRQLEQKEKEKEKRESIERHHEKVINYKVLL